MFSAWCLSHLSCHRCHLFPCSLHYFLHWSHRMRGPWAVTISWLPASHFLISFFLVEPWFSSFWHLHTICFWGPHKAPECRIWLVYTQPGRSIPLARNWFKHGLCDAILANEKEREACQVGDFLEKFLTLKQGHTKSTVSHLFSTSRQGYRKRRCLEQHQDPWEQRAHMRWQRGNIEETWTLEEVIVPLA